MNEIKIFWNEKAEKITLEDIIKVSKEIDKLVKFADKKNKLKQNLENCNNKINENKKKLSQLNENENISNEEQLNEFDKVEEVEAEYENESNNQTPSNKKKKKY